MPRTLHTEEHSLGANIVAPTVIGMYDGLTVSFALAAGLSGAAFMMAKVIS
jgi:hypothetical protein